MHRSKKKSSREKRNSWKRAAQQSTDQGTTSPATSQLSGGSADESGKKSGEASRKKSPKASGGTSPSGPKATPPASKNPLLIMGLASTKKRSTIFANRLARLTATGTFGAAVSCTFSKTFLTKLVQFCNVNRFHVKTVRFDSFL